MSERRPSVIDFRAIGSAALPVLAEIVRRWLPDGRRVGNEWIALNPTRVDRRLGAFKVNLRTGHWADFSSGDKGGDVISLAAYLYRISQADAARKVAAMLGLNGKARR